MSSPFGQGFRAGSQLRADIDGGTLKVPEIIQTGIFPIDELTRGGADLGGLRTGEVSIIGASTGHGKSALAEQIALEVSKRHRTTFFALELDRQRSEVRMLSKLMRLELGSVVNLMTNQPGHPGLRKALDELTYERMLIVEERDEATSFRSEHLFTMVRANAPKVIVVDHPRHIDDWHGGQRGERSDLAAARITRQLVGMAKATDAHVIIVAQTTRDLLGKRPSARDLADTYVLAQAADLVVMLHRPFRGRGHLDNVAELIIDKNRNGPEGIVHMRWTGSRMTYSDLSPGEEAALECCGSPKKRDDSDLTHDAF